MTSDQILQRGIDRMPGYAVFAFDPDGIALTWNEGVQHVLGYARDEFVGHSVDRIFTPEAREQGEPEHERRQASTEDTVGDFRWHVRKGGALLWANGAVHAVHGDDGTIAGFVKIMRDASRDKCLQVDLEQARAELEARVDERTRELTRINEELQKSETRFREVFRVAPIAILLTTRGDDILDGNEAFERVTGYACEEVVGRNAKQMGFWGSPEDQRKLREVQADERGFRMLELSIRTKDGKVREILSSAAAVGFDGHEGLVKMFLDVTERKQTERYLQQALQEVMQDTSWLAQQVIEKLAQVRGEQAAGTSVSDLTPRERDVLMCIAKGRNNQQIGHELGLAPSTVRNYVTHLYAKLGVTSRAEAVVWARERGLGGA